MRFNWLHRVARLPLDNSNERRHLWPALKQLYSRFMHHRGMQAAASLTYTTLFAVVPLTAVVYSILSTVPEFQGVGDKLQQYLFDQFVPATGEQVRQQLNNFSNQARNLTFVGVGFLFVTAVMMMVSVESAFNSIWQAPSRRSGVSSFLMYWAVLTLGPLLIGAAFVFSSYVASLRMFNDAMAGFSDERLLHLISPMLSFLALLFVYMVIPNARVRFRHAAVGSAVTAVLIELAKFGFGLYVTNFRSYELIYGAFAAVPLFLLWIYVSWIIILLGAEIIAWLADTRSGDWQQQAPLWQSLVILAWMHQRQCKGQQLQTHEISAHLGGGFRKLMQPMEDNGWVIETEDATFVLARSLETLPLWQLIEELPWSIPDTPAPDHLPRDVDCDTLNDCIAKALSAKREALNISVAALFPAASSHLPQRQHD